MNIDHPIPAGPTILGNQPSTSRRIADQNIGQINRQSQALSADRRRLIKQCRPLRTAAAAIYLRYYSPIDEFETLYLAYPENFAALLSHNSVVWSTARLDWPRAQAPPDVYGDEDPGQLPVINLLAKIGCIPTELMGDVIQWLNQPMVPSYDEIYRGDWLSDHSRTIAILLDAVASCYESLGVTVLAEYFRALSYGG